MGEVEKILEERGKTHGEFTTHARISQKLKSVARMSGMGSLPLPHVESLEMIFHKIARILNGNPDHVDHWDDIAGYATLIAKELRKGENECGAE